MSSDQITALERAANKLSEAGSEAAYHGAGDIACQYEADASTIRALIVALHSGKLVRREDVVRETRLQALRDAISEIERWRREAKHTSASTEAHIQSLNAGMGVAKLAIVGLINKDEQVAETTLQPTHT